MGRHNPEESFTMSEQSNATTNRKSYPWRSAPRTTVLRESLSDFYHTIVLPVLGIAFAGFVLVSLFSAGGGSRSARQTILQMEADRARQQHEDLDRRVLQAAQAEQRRMQSASESRSAGSWRPGVPEQ
jgi:hypothetical protein